MVEIFSGNITRQTIRRATFTSAPGPIRTFIDGCNQRREPFGWTKTADQILGKADRQRTRHATLSHSRVNPFYCQYWDDRILTRRPDLPEE
jgi:hypothetical protein